MWDLTTSTNWEIRLLFVWEVGNFFLIVWEVWQHPSDWMSSLPTSCWLDERLATSFWLDEGFTTPIWLDERLGNLILIGWKGWQPTSDWMRGLATSFWLDDRLATSFWLDEGFTAPIRLDERFGNLLLIGWEGGNFLLIGWNKYV